MIAMALAALLGIYTVNTANNSLVIDAQTGEAPRIVYYGARLDDPQAVSGAGYKGEPAYPAYGLVGTDETALSITQADGNVTLNLKITDVNRSMVNGLETLTITSKDTYYPVTVRNVYVSYRDQDIIATHAEIINEGKEPIVLNRYFSGCLPIRMGNVWISSLYGTWANEGRVCTEPLTRGFKVIKNIDGTRNSHTSHSEVMISLDGKPQENSGRVIGAALAWPGNYVLEFQTNDTDFHHFLAGICPDNAAYTLAPGEPFTTPDLLFSYSDKGMSGVSRNYHHWGRKYVLAHGNTPRKILLNSWEGVYFDINEPGMDQMMNDISSMGGELFVMDDGWFGNKYQRLTDNSSLGDWVVDKKKLPHGIGSLVKTADKYGIKFGIWIEPEMTNNPSELYEKHPDWVLKAANRDLVYGRGGTQLVLDLCNPEVQDFVFGVVDNLMTENQGIDYIKWDANMPISAHGSQYLKNQSHLNVEYWKGFSKVMDRVREKYPDLTIQCCASGGGRANWGALKGFDEFWVSDNTDALQRIFMQWGTSYFFPAIAMGQHISAVPNHTVFRTTSLKFRVDVAMSGRLGMEIQPKNMSAAEKEFCRKAIADYKRIRPIVQFGDIYRLISPDDGQGVASLMHVTADKESAVFYWYKLENMYDAHLPRVKMAGLDPSKKYKVTELNRIDLSPLPFENQVFSGRFLMENGLEIPYNHNVNHSEKCDWSSRVLLLEENLTAEKTLFNNNWKFALGNAASMEKDFTHGTEYFTQFAKVNSNNGNLGPASGKFDDSAWKTVNLPHDWVVDLPYSGEASHSHGYKCIGWKYPENSVGWYCKHFTVPQEDKGKEIGIEFESIFRDAEVFCNGIYLGHERSGYAVQYYDLTDVLNYGGENVITVRCDASFEEGWYYEGAGIYRNVWLHKGGYCPEKGPGARDFRFDPEQGFILDGQRVQLRGCDLHLDAAGVGVAVPKELWRYRLGILKEYGFNCIRSSHNPASEDFLDLCDEMGFFVIDENRCFGSNEEQFKGLENMITHHKHHPCIIAWSVGNEEWSVEWNETGTAMAKAMCERVHKADPTRPATYGSSGGQAPNYGVDVFGYNYIIQNPIERNHIEFPDHCALGTEETTGCGTRGEYVTVPEEGWMLAHNRKDSIDHIETGWRFYKERPWLAGLCYWTGFDYRGESNPMVWPATGSQFGIFDYCGFPKDEAYYLKAWWTDEPVLHICGPANGEIRVYSNCEEVELFEGRKSLGRKSMPKDGHLDWEIGDASASFTAKGYSKGDKTLTDVYPEVIKGTTLKASKTTLMADGQDIVVIDIVSAEPTLEVSVEGATFLGWGNGNPGFKETERPLEGNSLTIKTFNGRAQIIVRSVEGVTGNANVTVGSETATISVQK